MVIRRRNTGWDTGETQKRHSRNIEEHRQNTANGAADHGRLSDEDQQRPLVGLGWGLEHDGDREYIWHWATTATSRTSCCCTCPHARQSWCSRTRRTECGSPKPSWTRRPASATLRSTGFEKEAAETAPDGVEAPLPLHVLLAPSTGMGLPAAGAPRPGCSVFMRRGAPPRVRTSVFLLWPGLPSST